MTAESDKIVIGTRGSELALAQARLVEKAIQSTRSGLQLETKIIVTTGDNTRKTNLAGWKGLFTAEIERALLSGEVDLAVHSAKDLPSVINSGARIAAVLPRSMVNDVLISKHAGGLEDLPRGATVATSSVRRKHQLHWKRRDLSVVDLRGNVPTRLRKLDENNWDAIVLARAGLERLGVLPQEGSVSVSLASGMDLASQRHALLQIDLRGTTFFAESLPPDTFLPAGGQGVIAIQVRSDDKKIRAIVDPVNDRDTQRCLQAEREFLRLMNVDCNAPVGVLATISDGIMRMRAQFFEQGSVTPREGEVEGVAEDGERLAEELLNRLRARTGA